MFKFKSSSPSGDNAASNFEAVRKRARHRLIGATALVLLGVIGFPLVFQTQPRPVPVDVQIVIPEKNHVESLPVPPAQPVPIEEAPVVVAKPAARPVEPVEEELAQVSAQVAPSQPLPQPAAAVAAPKPATPKPPVEAVNKPEPTPQPEPKPEKPAEAVARLVVQVGAFADPARAQEVRSRLERAGLKTYTNVAKTPDGDRIRVRVGPFAKRSEAEAAAAKIKQLSLPAAILTL